MPTSTLPELSRRIRSLVELDAPVSKISPPSTPLLAALMRPRTCFVPLSCCSKARKTDAPSALDDNFNALPEEPICTSNGVSGSESPIPQFPEPSSVIVSPIFSRWSPVWSSTNNSIHASLSSLRIYNLLFAVSYQS